MTTHDVLYEAYERFHRTGLEFGGDEHGNGLTNHGPMAAETLVRRGFAAEVPRWVDRYVDRLVELPGSRRPISPDADWREALGAAGASGTGATGSPVPSPNARGPTCW